VRSSQGPAECSGEAAASSHGCAAAAGARLAFSGEGDRRTRFGRGSPRVRALRLLPALPVTATPAACTLADSGVPAGVAATGMTESAFAALFSSVDAPAIWVCPGTCACSSAQLLANASTSGMRCGDLEAPSCAALPDSRSCCTRRSMSNAAASFSFSCEFTLASSELRPASSAIRASRASPFATAPFSCLISSPRDTTCARTEGALGCLAALVCAKPCCT
jgi:hypothetical protein